MLIFLLFCSACTENKSVIEGKLPNKSYDNEVVYLVPFKGATKETVDSALIKDGSFRFILKPKKQNQVFIVRVKPLLRLSLQDLLIISEPGTVYVNLNSSSSASGTPLNQTLQQWKEKKFVYDSTFYSFNRQYRKETDESVKKRLQSELDELNKEYKTYEDSLIEKNRDNPAGQFIRSLHQP